MPDTKKQKKYPLLFFTMAKTQEVHTFRENPRDENEGYASCGKKLLDSYGEVDRDAVRVTCKKCLDLYTKRFTWTVQFTVNPVWVADGFDLTDERALDMLANDLSYANIGTELDAKVLTAPDPDEIAMEQGYRDAAHMKGDK
jgi:hypothetical protein